MKVYQVELLISGTSDYHRFKAETFEVEEGLLKFKVAGVVVAMVAVGMWVLIEEVVVKE